ncbi:hypothetical protein IQ13_0664 [Lacibacter cauensis]|uniref:Uncharacterized protein n=2 Tax=Lacibacter cauensis TaxID=510947 RepID=A0A562SW77_9BACT|nr:hypothetical protein IQ13_0664 [Lacibacter cauensis]
MYLKYISFITVVYLMLATGCRKTVDTVMPSPEPIDTTSYLQLNFAGIPSSQGGMYAILSITNENGDSIITNRKVAITTSNQQYISEKIKLEKKSYKLSKLIVVKSTDTALFATPQAQSAKAVLVNATLPLPVSITAKGTNPLTVSVLPVIQSESPILFGYTGTDFGFEAFLTLKTHLQVTVGAVVYDSLPGTLKLEAVKANGERWLREINLRQGLTNVQVPQEYASYTFSINKWNTSIQKQYTRAALNDNMLITFSSSRPAKRLMEESVFIDNAYAVTAESRSEYVYNQHNKLQTIRYYQKSLQVSGLPLTFVYQFHYSQMDAWDTVYRYDAVQALTGYTAMTRTNGEIRSIYNKSYDQQTGAAVNYGTANGDKEIRVDYLFSNNNSMLYTMKIVNGNRVEDRAQSSTGGAEAGSYAYDVFINPYHQLGYDDLYFSNISKNNLLVTSKNYAGAIPSNIPYKYEYVYDADGYPAEAYISYKGYSSQQHLFRIKKVFRYQ